MYEYIYTLVTKKFIHYAGIFSYYVRETIFKNSKYQCDDRTRGDIAKAVIAHKRGLESVLLRNSHISFFTISSFNSIIICSRRFIKEVQDNNAFTYAVLLLFAVTSLAINLFRVSILMYKLNLNCPFNFRDP